MAYVDDVVIMGRRLQDVKEVFTSLIEQGNKMGLEINEKKTKFMTVSRKTYNENKNVKMGTYNFEIVKDYTYLGTVLTNKNELRPEIEKRITNANRAYYALLPILKSQSVLRTERVKIYKTLIRPVVTYGAESWTLNKDIAKGLAVFERKILRRIFGAIKVNENWRK
jgi:hypothetical protein